MPIQQVLTPLVNEQEQDRARIARLLNIILLAGIGLTALAAALVWIWSAPQEILLLNLALLVALVALWIVAQFAGSSLERLLEQYRSEIAERKRTEVALQESAEKARLMFESMDDGIAVTDLDGHIVQVNQAFVRMHGASTRDELIGLHSTALIAPDDRDRVWESFRKLTASGHGGLVEYRLLRKDGIQADGELNTVVLKDAQGNPNGYIGIARDITARKRTEQELRRRAEAEAIWNTVGKTVIATHDLDEILTTVIETISQKMQVETGSIWLWEPGSAEMRIARTLKGDTERFAAYRLRPGEGIAGWVAQHRESALVPNPSQDPRHSREMARDIGMEPRSILCVPLLMKDQVLGVIELLNKQNGEFTQQEVQLLESLAAPVAIAIQNARLNEQVQKQFGELSNLLRRVEHIKSEWELTIDTIDEGITLVDNRCTIVRANKTLARWVNCTPGQLVGKYCYQVIHGLDAPPDRCPHAISLANQNTLREMEIEEPHLGGTFRLATFPLQDASGKNIGAVNVLKDITAEKRLQSQMVQSEKLAAMGRLAASLAHEINNPLQAIQGCLDLAQTSAGNAPKQQRFLSMAQDEFNRLTNIVQHMLDFFRPSKGVQASLDMTGVLNDVLSLSHKRMQHAKVNVTLEWETKIPPITGVSNQLQQVLLNLLLNAVEAMPEGGEIRIRNAMRIEDGEWLTISIADSGCGVPPQDLDKIFEPFYTTKPNGTGLGLAVCRNIIANHGGRITVDSTVGQGSTFTVWLPIAQSIASVSQIS